MQIVKLTSNQLAIINAIGSLYENKKDINANSIANKLDIDWKTAKNNLKKLKEIGK